MNEETLTLARKFSRQYEYTVRGSDTDRDDNITMHALMSLIQEAASVDAQFLGFGACEFDTNGFCWLLLRAAIRLEDKPRWLDSVVIDTWTNGVDKLIAFRDFLISDVNGHVYGKATTSWLVADKATKRPRRISILGIPHMEQRNYSVLGYDAPSINGYESVFDTESIMTKTAVFSEIDRNNHVNNTKYIAWSLDALSNARSEFDFITGFDINYNSEVLLNDEIALYHMPYLTGSRREESSSAADLIAGKNTKTEKAAFVAIVYTKST